MKKKKIEKITLVIWLALLAIGAIVLISRYQIKNAAYISSLLNETTGKSELSQAEQVAQLRQEVEELKKQQTVAAEKSNLKPAPAPNNELKTQEDLDRAKAQISSLTQQLAQLQKEKNQAAAKPSSDSDLLKSWSASEKVVQVACQDKFFNSWQVGSGALISADGKILTNQHVVQSSLGLTLPDFCLVFFSKDFDQQTQIYKKQYRANVAGLFENRDAAMLKISDVIFKDSAGNVQTVAFAGTFSYFDIIASVPQIGDPVYVIGFPESASFTFSVTKGIISNLTSDGLYFGTDAQIDRGNSGGAALNSSGQLIGLPTWKYAGSGDYRGYILDIQKINTGQ